MSNAKRCFKPHDEGKTSHAGQSWWPCKYVVNFHCSNDLLHRAAASDAAVHGIAEAIRASCSCHDEK